MYDRTDSDAQLKRVLIVTTAGCVAGACFAWLIFAASVGPLWLRVFLILCLYCWVFGGVCGMLAAAVFRKRSGVRA